MRDKKILIGPGSGVPITVAVDEDGRKYQVIFTVGINLPLKSFPPNVCALRIIPGVGSAQPFSVIETTYSHMEEIVQIIRTEVSVYLICEEVRKQEEQEKRKAEEKTVQTLVNLLQNKKSNIS